jgi:hypothetical protein
MRALEYLLSLVRGVLWLFRQGGARQQLEKLERQAACNRAALTDMWNGLGQQLAILDARLVGMVQTLRQLDRDVQWLRGCLAASQKAIPAADLRNFEERICSQNGEDGILAEIFRRIGTSNCYFVEFGVESGRECNSARLALQEGWQGLFLEADPESFTQLQQRYAGHPRVRCVQARVTSTNIEALFAAEQVSSELDLLSIDIDGNDYWVWAALRRWRPRVVVIEYNASHPPGGRWVMKEDPRYRWNGTTYFGASLASLAALGRQKGYTLVGTTSTGVNAFFVRDDLVAAERFLDPVVHYHYSPATHGSYPGGHPRGEGPFVAI